MKCFKLENIILSKRISVLHDKESWSCYSPCIDLPGAPEDEIPFMSETDDILHLVDTMVIEEKNMDWEQIYRLVVGFNLEN